MTSRLPLPLLSLAFLGSFACSSSSGDGGPPPAPPAVDTSAPSPTATTPPAPPPAPPKPPITPSFPTVESHGGPVIASPRVMPIVFAGDPLTTQIGDFAKKLAGSAFWSGLGSEYGVGALRPPTRSSSPKRLRRRSRRPRSSSGSRASSP